MERRQVVAVVPMRHNSERVKGKNYRFLGGIPLFHHILETLLACDGVSTVVVDTDSPVILEGLERHFPAVERRLRPEGLRDDTVSMNDVLRAFAATRREVHILQTHCTNPLLAVDTVERAVASYFDALPEYDSLFSVTRIRTRFWTRDGKPLNHDPDVLMRTQDLEPMLEENSNIYIFPRQAIMETGNRIGRRPLLFEMEPAETVDIDEECDFQFAEFLHARRSAS